MLRLGLRISALDSVVAAAAPDIVVLILARAVQGVGGAMCPLALARAHGPRTGRPGASPP
jgi:MFS family permease